MRTYCSSPCMYNVTAEDSPLINCLVFCLSKQTASLHIFFYKGGKPFLYRPHRFYGKDSRRTSKTGTFLDTACQKCFYIACSTEYPAKMHTEDQYHYYYVKDENNQDTHFPFTLTKKNSFPLQVLYPVRPNLT